MLPEKQRSGRISVTFGSSFDFMEKPELIYSFGAVILPRKRISSHDFRLHRDRFPVNFCYRQ